LNARSCIRADVGLHAEVPLLALFRLVHVGVAPPLPVLGRGGRSDDRGVHHSPLTHEQALLGQVGVDGVEDGFRQPLLFGIKNPQRFTVLAIFSDHATSRGAE
jgi:hypothetical protein